MYSTCPQSKDVDRSIAGPDPFIDTNVSGTHSLLKAARRVWIDEKRVASHRFHQVSTDEVYGSLRPEDSPFTESTPYAPNSPYSASKAAADHLVRAYQHTYGLAVTTSCCSNNYGPYQFPEKLIPLMIVHILEGKSLPVYGDGRHVRDWLHVLDHCHGIERILVRGRSGAVYNLGGRCECANLTLVRKVCQIADECFAADPALGERFPNSPAARGASAELIRLVKDRAGHDRRYAIDCSKAERELGFSARTSLAAGLRRTFDWYLEHETWWRAIREGSAESVIVLGEVSELRRLDRAFAVPLSHHYEPTFREFLDVTEYFDVARIGAHMFRPCKELGKFRIDDLRRLHALEVNGKDFGTEVMLLVQARALGLPIVAGSDAHHWLQLGVRHTLVHLDEIRIASIVKSIREGLTGFATSPYTPLRVRGAKSLKKITKLLRKCYGKTISPGTPRPVMSSAAGT